MEEPVIVHEEKDDVAVLTFNRPDKLNALSSAMVREFQALLHSLAESPSIRVIVLTGAGRAFMAGADIQEYVSFGFPEFVSFTRSGRRLNHLLDTFPKPVIAAVNGYALGGGFEIALCCDVIIASTRAKFGLPEGLLGLCPGGGGTQRLTRAVGRNVAADVLLSARRLTAQEAMTLGLVAQVVEPEALMEAAIQKARDMCRIAPLASREMKRLIREGLDAALETGLSLEQEVLFRLYRTEDATEGIQAFTEKRPPRFSGR